MYEGRNSVADSEAPDNSGGRPVCILVGVGVMRVDIVTLQSPGEIFEEYLVVSAAAHIDRDGVVDDARRVHSLQAAHGLDKWAPFSEGGRQAGAKQKVIRLDLATADSGAVIAAGVEHSAKMQ